MSDRDRIERLAGRLSDGEGVDWDAERQRSGLPAEHVEGLEVVEAVMQAYRDASEEADPRSESAPLFRWGHLDVLEKIGEGGFGEVFRAYDPRLDRVLALKLAGRTAAATVTRSLAEARRLARVRHPNVATIYGADVHDGRPGFWTDLVEGKTLRDLVTEQGSLGGLEAASIGLDLCRALAAIHSAGLVHGDVKPANVMRATGGQTILLDFGATRERRSPDLDDALQATPATSAPEVLADGRLTSRADLYSLGATLYFLLTGRYPHPGEETRESERIDATATVPLRDRRPDLPIALILAVERALEPEAERRVPSAGAMERLLLDAVAELTNGNAVSGSPSLAAADRKGTNWLKRIVIDSALLALVLLVPIVVRLADLYETAREEPAGPVQEEDPAGALRERLVRLKAEAAREDRERRDTRTLMGLTPPQITAGFLGAARPLLDVPGEQRDPTFSPDGQWIAFVDEGPWVQELSVQQIGLGSPRPLAALRERISRLRWTERGEILFEVEGRGIWSLPADGSAKPSQILPRGGQPAPFCDGERLLFVLDGRLHVADVEGSGASPLRGVPPLRRPESAEPAVSADDEWVVWIDGGERGDLWRAPMAGGEPRRLTFDRRPIGSPTFTPDGSAILFWSERTGSRLLWKVPAEGGTVELVSGEAATYGSAAISPSGKSLVASRRVDTHRLRLADPRRSMESLVNEERRPLLEPRATPVGSYLVYTVALGAEGTHVFVLHADGGTPRRLTFAPGAVHSHPHWSSGGDSVYFYRHHLDRTELRRVPIQAGDGETVADLEVDTSWGDVGPDGRRLLFDRCRESGQEQTGLYDLQTAKMLLFPTPKLHHARWSRDGRTVLGSRDDGSVVVCQVETLRCDAVAHDADRQAVWLVPGRTILFARSRDVGIDARPAYDLWRLDIDGGERRIGPMPALAPLGLLGGSAPFDVTADGRLVLVEVEPGPERLWIGSLS